MFRNKHKSLSKISKEPKTKEYNTIFTLLNDAERWRNVGDKELEKKTWRMIAEKATLYSEGMKEIYSTKCGIVRPDTTTNIEL